MNYIDLLLLLIMLLSVWAAVQRGFIISALALLSWAGSLLIGFWGYHHLGVLLHKCFPSLGIWTDPLSFILLIVIARLLLDSLADRIIVETPYYVHRNVVNKLLGVIPGAINGFIWIAILATFLLLLPFTNDISQKARESRLTDGVVAKVAWLEEKLYPIFTPVVNRNSITIEDSRQAVKLPYKLKHFTVRPDLEAKMLELVNKERTERGLQPLKADPEMRVVARKHSVDMFERGYFSHYTPEGLDPFVRMRLDHIHFLTAGENLAVAPTLSIAHTGLMHSPGHRANILNPAFGRVGIGIEDGGIYGLMITQDFRN